jgi:hypothetical protein
MHQFNFENMKGELRAVMGHDLANLTTQGWNLVFCYQETSHLPYNEMEPGNTPGCYGGVVNVQRFKPNTSTYFVLHRNEETVVTELNSHLAAARAALQQEQDARKKDGESLRLLKKDLAEAKDLAKTWENQKKVANDERDRFRTTVTKLEGDMVKIRKAIGERAFNEILPPIETPPLATKQTAAQPSRS